MELSIYHFLIIILIFIFLIVYLKLIDYKYKRYVNDNSVKIKKIKELNSQYNFHKLNKSSNIFKFYDNKSNYNRITPAMVLRNDILNNILEYKKVIISINENRKQLLNYIEKKKTIINEKIKYNNNLIKPRKFERLENNLISSLILKPITEVNIFVTMHYSSPKGRVNLYKRAEFNFNDIKTSLNSLSRSKLDKKTRDELNYVERGEVSDSLRYDVFTRDGYKCKICGASANQGVQLHVDHIVPISKGGKSNFNNLQTLCERCNIGKSNKI